MKKNEKSPNKAKIDFNDMESLFCQQAPSAPVSNGNSGGGVGSGKDTTNAANEDQKKKQEVGGIIIMPSLYAQCYRMIYQRHLEIQNHRHILINE